MRLVDTSLWVDHLRHALPELASARLTHRQLRTQDRRLLALAQQLGQA